MKVSLFFLSLIFSFSFCFFLLFSKQNQLKHMRNTEKRENTQQTALRVMKVLLADDLRTAKMESHPWKLHLASPSRPFQAITNFRSAALDLSPLTAPPKCGVFLRVAMSSKILRFDTTSA